MSHRPLYSTAAAWLQAMNGRLLGTEDDEKLYIQFNVMQRDPGRKGDVY